MRAAARVADRHPPSRSACWSGASTARASPAPPHARPPRPTSVAIPALLYRSFGPEAQGSLQEW